MTVMNPFAVARKRLHLTQQGMAFQTGLSRQAIIRTEQAFYPEPPVGLVDYLIDHLPDLDYADLLDQYKDFQHATRLANFGALEPNFPVGQYLTSQVKLGTHPMTYWRTISKDVPSINALCKSFCIPQNIMQKFEQEPHLVNSVPEPLWDALLESGYRQQVLENLSLAYLEFKTARKLEALSNVTVTG